MRAAPTAAAATPPPDGFCFVAGAPRAYRVFIFYFVRSTAAVAAAAVAERELAGLL